MQRFIPLVALVAGAVQIAPAQLIAGVGSATRGISLLSVPGWQTSAQLSSAFRLDSPLSTTILDGAIETRFSGPALNPGSFSSSLATPASHGLRLFGEASADRDRSVNARDNRGANANLSYRSGFSGAWLGYGVDRGMLPSLSTGIWRQLHGVTLSLRSAFRSGRMGARPHAFVNGTVRDSVPSDTGWIRTDHPGIFGDSGSPGKTFSWSETEARLGWSAGRLTFDGLLGWRSPLDSAPRALWLQGFATVQLSSKLGLSVGAGSVTRRAPWMQAPGRFLSASLRVSPAALLRPRSVVPVTPAAASFSIRKDVREYVVTIRVPKARVVELAGDFNNWRAVRLDQVRPDVWEVALPVGPGTYRMNLRIDGERWIAPPGTVTVDDEFNGRVGLVVIR